MSTPTADLQSELDAHGPEVLARLNDTYGDSLLLVVRHLGGAPDAGDVRAVAVDPVGLDLEVSVGGATRSARVDFDAPLTAADQVTSRAFALVTAARAASGEPGQTSAERVMAQLGAIRTFVTTVQEVEQVHPHLRRITVAGGDLATYAPAGPDTFLYVLLPPAGRSELTIDQSFTWAAYQEMPEEERPLGAYYTQRAWRPEVAELDLLFVLHGDEGAASRWAATAAPGDPVALWGPRTAWEPPADTEWYLLVADDTGLPAVAAILEWLPPDAVVRVVAEVEDDSEHQPLPPLGPSVEVTWLHRHGAAPGTTTLLPDAVRALDLPAGQPYVWGGGESRTMTQVRKHVRRELGFEREQVSLVAYWRHADHTADDPDPDE